MLWLSQHCVLLSSSDLIDSNYLGHKSAAGQFDVFRPYQASTVHSTKTELEDAAADPSPSQAAFAATTAGAASAQAQTDSSLDKTSPVPILKHTTDHRRKRKRKHCSDPRAESRRAESQDRHDAWTPMLSAAYGLLQSYLQTQPASRGCLHLSQKSDRSFAITAEPYVQQSSSVSSDRLDLVPLHDLKHVLRPKFSFSASEYTEHQTDARNLFDIVIRNNASEEKYGDACGHQVLIPKQASFLLSDVKRLSPLLPGWLQRLLFYMACINVPCMTLAKLWLAGISKSCGRLKMQLLTADTALP